VQDAFALIKVDGLSGIRGYLNNLEIGKTDSQGRLFVPDLLSYYGNNLGISRKDLPLNYNIDAVNKVVAAPYRGGVLVDFPVKRIQRIVGKAIIESGGKPFVPKHGQLTILVPGSSVDSPLGNNGEFYFENLKNGRFQAQIEFADQTCEFTLEVPESVDEVVELGTQRCLMPPQ
jgi:outer membrane usher protein